MRYKDYIARVEYDDEAGILHGQVINIPDVITFQGTSVDEIRKAFEESVEDYLAFCAERGEEPNKPYSGNFPVRGNSELHRKIALRAAAEDKSLNTWVVEKLEEAVARDETVGRLEVDALNRVLGIQKAAESTQPEMINWSWVSAPTPSVGTVGVGHVSQTLRTMARQLEFLSAAGSRAELNPPTDTLEGWVSERPWRDCVLQLFAGPLSAHTSGFRFVVTKPGPVKTLVTGSTPGSRLPDRWVAPNRKLPTG